MAAMIVVSRRAGERHGQGDDRQLQRAERTHVQRGLDGRQGDVDDAEI
jgi:hypothetical protein